MRAPASPDYRSHDETARPRPAREPVTYAQVSTRVDADLAMGDAL